MYLILNSTVALDFKSVLGDKKLTLRHDFIYTVHVDPKAKGQTNFTLMEGNQKRCDLKSKELEIVLRYGMLTANLELAERYLLFSQRSHRRMVRANQ